MVDLEIESKQMELAFLQRSDSNITRIHFTSTFSAIYEFDDAA